MKRYRRKASDATRFKMRISKLGRNNPMYGKHHTETTKQKISRSMKKYWDGVYDAFYDYLSRGMYA
jgi:hypothetical protein